VIRHVCLLVGSLVCSLMSVRIRLPAAVEGVYSGWRLGNANPGDIFQTRVYGFGGLQTRVPGFDVGLWYIDNIGLSIWHAAGTVVDLAYTVTLQC